MANGFCTAILKQLAETGISDPAKKVSQLGFLQMLFCCQDGSINGLNDGFANGHKRNLSVWYRERFSDSIISDTMPACDTGNNLPRKEFTLPALQTSAASLYFSVDDIRNYCADASAPTQIGRKTIMRDMYDQITNAMFRVLEDIDRKLVASMSTQFGTNIVTGSDAETVITYDPAKAFADVIKKLILDQQENEFCADACIVGNGGITTLDFEAAIAAVTSAAGINMQALYGLLPRVFRDNNTRTAWGANQFGVFEKGSLALLNYPQYVNNFDQKLANTDYFQAMLPVDEIICPQDCLDTMQFDISVREIDCPTTMTINGAQTTVDRGYQVVISKQYQLFVKPDLYAAGDSLSGTNGTLRYELEEAAPAGGGTEEDA